MPLTSGMRLGPYEIVDTVGAGGMGEVYRARDTRLERDVAIKVLPARTADDPDAVARLQREARTIAALSHPSIVAIFDVGSDRDRWFIVTELLQGETLRDRLARGALPVHDAVRCALELARGLAAAHDRGVVHRDLKPENVFLTADRRVKILDFGLAKPMTAALSGGAAVTMLGETSPGIILGTVGYMSPEQAQGSPTDARSDFFALGAMLYEMLSGRRAFASTSLTGTLSAIMRDDPPSFAELGVRVPPAVERIVRRCLEKQPSARFQSAHDLAFALESATESGASSAVETPASGGAVPKAVVVLPFENISADPENEFFADGLTEELIADLSRIQAFRVISRASAMRLKGRRDVQTIARELNVAYVLSGSVRKAGARLRITAQLVDAATDTPIWSEKYNGTVDDVFEIQEQVSRAIARELEVKLTPEESREIAKRPIGDARAYEWYLRARSEVLRFTEEGLERAQRDIQNAIAIVGESVPLLAVLGEIHWQYYNLGLTTDPRRLDEVERLARRIEALEPGSPHALRLLVVHALHTNGDMALATRLATRALEADPSDTLAAIMHVCGCGFLGRPERAAKTVERLLQLDPLQPLAHAIVGWAGMLQGRFAIGLSHARRALELDPHSPAAVLFAAQCLGSLGRADEAVHIVAGLEQVRPTDKWTWLCQLVKWGLQRDHGRIRETLTPDLRAWCASDPQYSLLLAEVFALAGASDDAFEWLEIAVGRGVLAYEFMDRIDPFLASLRADPRWEPLMARVRALWERVEL